MLVIVEAFAVSSKDSGSLAFTVSFQAPLDELRESDA